MMARTPAPVAPPASRMVPRFAIRPANSYLPGIAVVELRMGNWTPSIVPNVADQTVYMVVDDLGHLGEVWREAGVEMTDLESVITDLLEGQVPSPSHRL
jgi:hypothetical protein